MHKSAHQAALDQANLLASYLAATPTSSLDLHFIRRHLDTLESFVQATQADSAVVMWADRAPDSVDTEASVSGSSLYR